MITAHSQPQRYGGDRGIGIGQVCWAPKQFDEPLDEWSTPGSRFQANSTGLLDWIERLRSHFHQWMDAWILNDCPISIWICSRILKTLDSWNIKAWWSWGPHNIALVVSVNCGCYRCRSWISNPNEAELYNKSSAIFVLNWSLPASNLPRDQGLLETGADSHVHKTSRWLRKMLGRTASREAWWTTIV